MRTGNIFITGAAAAAFICLSSIVNARESAPDTWMPDAVTPLSTFTFDVSGFNSAGTTGYLLTPDETATFGATTTYTAVGINGQNISITSSETYNTTANTTTDTFVVSTPTSFLTTAKVNNTTIAELQFDIGDANAGGGTVSFAVPVPSGYTDSAYLLYGTAPTTFAYTPATTVNVFTNNNQSLAVGEGVNFGAAIYQYAPNTLSYSLTYTTVALVPEPSTMALGGFGLVGLGLAIGLRRRKEVLAA